MKSFERRLAALEAHAPDRLDRAADAMTENLVASFAAMDVACALEPHAMEPDDVARLRTRVRDCLAESLSGDHGPEAQKRALDRIANATR